MTDIDRGGAFAHLYGTWALLPEAFAVTVLGSVLVVNAVGENRAFEVDHNDGWLLSADGAEAALEHGSKTVIASRIVDAIVAFLHTGAR